MAKKTATTEPGAAPTYPAFAVAERRAKLGTAALTSQAIELIKQPEPMQLRWVYSAQSQSRMYQALRAEGYELVTWDELADPDIVPAIKSPDGKVVRGGKEHQEYLAKIPLRLYREITKTEQAQRKARRRDVKATQALAAQSMTEAAAEAGSDSERDLLHRSADLAMSREGGQIVQGMITESRERV